MPRVVPAVWAGDEGRAQVRWPVVYTSWWMEWKIAFEMGLIEDSVWSWFSPSVEPVVQCP